VEDNLRAVLISEMIISQTPEDILVVYGLGSCVAISLYDPQIKAGGMIHALLPHAAGRPPGNPAKFVDQGIGIMLEELLKLGAQRRRLEATIIGGARMLSGPGFENHFNIGEQNIQTAQAILQTMKVRLRGQEIGGNVGRTVKLHIANGTVIVKTLKEGEKIL